MISLIVIFYNYFVWLFTGTVPMQHLAKNFMDCIPFGIIEVVIEFSLIGAIIEFLTNEDLRKSFKIIFSKDDH